MKNKASAILLAVFLGGFGAHRFYLGQPIKGVIYLLFFWTLIPWFIAWVDVIVFLAMSEEKFNSKFNDGNIVAGGTVKSTGSNRAIRKQIISGLEKYFSEYPNASNESLEFVRNQLPNLGANPELVGEKVKGFLFEQVSKKGLDEKEQIREYVVNGLSFIPDNFDEALNQIYFSSIVDEYLSDEALDPGEIKSIVVKAHELGIEKYQSEERIREDYKYYVKNWEMDNGIFQTLESDFMLNKDEKCIYKDMEAEVLEQKETTRRINYSGPRARIKIVKGLSYNLGSYSYSTTKETIRASKGIGVLNITTKRILFKANQKSVTIRLSAVVDLEPFTDGVMIFKESGNPIIIKVSSGPELYQAIKGAKVNLGK